MNTSILVFLLFAASHLSLSHSLIVQKNFHSILVALSVIIPIRSCQEVIAVIQCRHLSLSHPSVIALDGVVSDVAVSVLHGSRQPPGERRD